MSNLACPICGNELAETERSYQCANGHSFDKAKSGYVNLLMSQNKKEKRHGDDKAMVLARKRFLEAGYYRILLEALLEVFRAYMRDGGVFLDIGCGEGWYTDHIFQALGKMGREVSAVGVDISKEALKFFSKRSRGIELAVASSSKLPMKAASCDVALSIFAPVNNGEIHRVLKEGGVFIHVHPLERHLLSLKKLIYKDVYENREAEKEIAGFALLESRSIRDRIHLVSNEDIWNLFMMTPYFYKTSRAGQEKLREVQELDTEVEFGINIYSAIAKTL